MIGYLKGKVAGIYEDMIVLETYGVGYNIYMSSSSIDLIEGLGASLKVYTYLSVREDAMQLFGFLTKDDLDTFRLLINVNGIGPKGALSILSVMTADDLRFAVMSGDAKSIGKAPGVGPKTAQRVIIDLKDRIDLETVITDKLDHKDREKTSALDAIRQDAIEALVALGYSQSDSYRAVRSVDVADDVETVLKSALSVI